MVEQGSSGAVAMVRLGGGETGQWWGGGNGKAEGWWNRAVVEMVRLGNSGTNHWWGGGGC